MSRRSILTVVAIAVLGTAIGFALYAKSASAVTPGTIAVAGDVRVDEDVVRAPSIVYPTPDYTVGIPTPANAAPKKPTASAPTATRSRLPVVSGFLSEVLVSQGAHVSRGQVVARLDTAMLDLGVQQAVTARTKARADVDALDGNLDKLADARVKLVKARTLLVKTRASLVATIGVLAKTRASLETSISLIQRIIAQPGGPPPHVPPYPVLLQALRQALAGLNKGLAGARLGLGKLDQGLAKLSSGLSQLDTLRAQLRSARKLLVINAAAQDVAVSLAKTRLGSATLVAPADGVVTYARAQGTAVMVGAPIVRIRPDGSARVYTYLTSDQLTRVVVGSRATVTFDSNPGASIAGHVSYLGDSATVPPTNFPTSIVHMTRAVRVTIELDDGRTAPPGTPVDIEISTSR
jgi:X-X-X-Leu-X-X-Gly heptad repeat protein